ncbi:MAG: response regulator transcription factor [Solirubrobacteraceae bacterium]|nr:response regulator transcription factor [Solirubrobacteraceae bacterium]
MIRILFVDDHPALRAGLEAVLRSEPGLVPVGAASGEADVWPILESTRPDVVLLDYHLPGIDGITLCRQIKRVMPPPAVVVYSAYADAKLAIPALLAGADGLVHKSAPAPELFDALRRASRGESALPPIGREQMEDAAGRIDPEDLPILGMLVEGTDRADIPGTLNLEPGEFASRLDRMIGALRVEVAARG